MSSATLTELLIKKIKQHRVLYDSRSPDYKNIRKKDRVWEKLGRELHISGDILKNKWRNLRDTYGKHLKSVSPLAGPNVKKSYKHWQWANHMEYFKPFLSYAYLATTEPEIIEYDNENSINMGHAFGGVGAGGNVGLAPMGGPADYNEIVGPLIDNSQQHHYGNIQSVTSIMEQEIDFLPVMRNRNKSPSIKSHKEERYKMMDILPQQIIEENLVQRYNDNMHRNLDLDATELIFLGYAKTVKTFSQRRQARFKMRLAQMVTEEEEEDEEDMQQFHDLALSSLSVPSSSDYISK